jgi:type II secretory pathway component PulM
MAMAREASRLSASATTTPLPQAQRLGAVQRLVVNAPIGDAKSVTVTEQDTGHIRVRCDDTDYGQWLAWLHGAREELGASIESVTVSAKPANGVTGRVRAEAVFSFGQANPPASR